MKKKYKICGAIAIFIEINCSNSLLMYVYIKSLVGFLLGSTLKNCRIASHISSKVIRLIFVHL